MNEAKKRSRMDKEYELTERLRMQLLGALHVGTLKPGSKLPSIREVAQINHVDHRVVTRAYTRLEEESLVEIRGRSGVYVAFASSPQEKLADERMHWVAGVLRDGWARRATFAELHNIMRRATLHRLRCVCVESTQDHLVAVSSELAGDFGFTVVPIKFTPTSSGQPESADAIRIEAEIRAADVIATTVFDASAVAQIAERANKPLIAVSISPALRDEIKKRILEGKLRVVVADPAFMERGKAFLQKINGGGGNIEFVLARDYKSEPYTESPTLYTKAARRELGLAEFHLISGDIPFICPESAREICELIVRLSCAEPQLTLLND